MLRIVLLLVASVFLSGCFATQPVRFSHGDLVLSAKRTGCSISDIVITNNGTKEKKVIGELNVVDAANLNQQSITYSCPTVYPGGKAECTSFVISSSKDRAGGLGCPNFKGVHNKFTAVID